MMRGRYILALVLLVLAAVGCATPAGVFIRGAAHLACTVYDAVDPPKNPAADLARAGLDADAGTADR